MSSKRTKPQDRSTPVRRRVAGRAPEASRSEVVSGELPLIKLNRAERAAERRQAIIEAAME